MQVNEVETMRDVWARIDAMRDQFTALSNAVWETPELNYEEYQSAAAHEQLLRKLGFRVETGIAGIPTAMVGRPAKAGRSSPFSASTTRCPAFRRRPAWMNGTRYTKAAADMAAGTTFSAPGRCTPPRQSRATGSTRPAGPDPLLRLPGRGGAVPARASWSGPACSTMSTRRSAGIPRHSPASPIPSRSPATRSTITSPVSRRMLGAASRPQCARCGGTDERWRQLHAGAHACECTHPLCGDR